MEPFSLPKIAAVLLATAFISVGAAQVVAPAAATHQPADKMAVAGSGLEILTTDLLEGSASQTEEILRGTMKASSPTDLVLQVTLECALWTDITTVGNDESSSLARVKVWVELDGVPVAVSGDDEGEDAGKVVFCDRAYRRNTLDFDDEDAQIQSYLRTRSAHAFNWIALNIGSGEHDIVVMAQLDTQVEGTGMAKAAIGKRTLVAEPTKLANDVTL